MAPSTHGSGHNYDSRIPRDQFATFIQGEFKLVEKGRDVRNLEEREKEILYCLIEFLKKQSDLQSKANQGILSSRDIGFLSEVEQVLNECINLIKELRERNTQNGDLDDFDV